MKKIIITGGSDGLGAALGRLCVAEKIEVVCLSRTAPGYHARHIVTDLADEQSVAAAAATILKSHADFIALVNCAGVISVQKPDAIEYNRMDNLFAVNVLAPIYLTSLLFDAIKKNHADIVNVGSTVGSKAYADQAAYGASKWALRGHSENLRLELKDTKCRVIQFSPGGFKSKLFEKGTGKEVDLHAFMNPDDLAATLLYTLRLPKSVEVSEILINRKAV